MPIFWATFTLDSFGILRTNSKVELIAGGYGKEIYHLISGIKTTSVPNASHCHPSQCIELDTIMSVTPGPRSKIKKQLSRSHTALRITGRSKVSLTEVGKYMIRVLLLLIGKRGVNL